jgi:hypothetical protein
MKRATVLLLALMLVPAAGAAAKFSSARVCGLSDCRAVDVTADRTLLPILETAFSRGPAFTAKPPEASPWYRVTLCPFRCSSRDAITLKVLPTAGYEYAWRGWEQRRRGWAKLDEPAADVYRRVTSGLEPFPASHLVAIGAEAPDPSSQGGAPTWAWVAIGAVVAVLGISSLGWRRGWRRSALAR